MTSLGTEKVIDAVLWVIPYEGKWAVFLFNQPQPQPGSAVSSRDEAIGWAIQHLDPNDVSFLRVYNEDLTVFREFLYWPAGRPPTKENYELFLRHFNDTHFRSVKEQLDSDHA